MTPEETHDEDGAFRSSGTRLARAERISEPPVRAGSFAAIHDVTLEDLLRLYARKRSTVALVLDGEERGEIVMAAGAIVRARFGALVGKPAVLAMLAAPEGLLRTTEVSSLDAARDDLETPRLGGPRPLRESGRVRTEARTPETTELPKAPRAVPPEAFPTAARLPPMPVFDSDSDPTRDVGAELAALRSAPKVPEVDGTTRFFMVERALVEACERALRKLTDRRALLEGRIALYVHGQHDPHGLHVAGGRIDCAMHGNAIAALRAGPSSAAFELRVAPLTIFGATCPTTKNTVLTVARDTFAASEAARVGKRFASLLFGDLAVKGARPPMRSTLPTVPAC